MTYRSFFGFVAFSLLFAGLGVGCGGTTPDSTGESAGSDNETQAAPLSEQPFVGVEEFESLRADGATVLDVRGEEDYQSGHIPGAVRASWTAFKEDDKDGAFIESEVSKLEDAARSLGIDNSEHVLIYGTAPSTLPARQAWSIEYIGHGKVHILDGGIEKWKQKTDEELSTETPDVERGGFEVAKRESIIAEKSDIEAALNDDTPVVLFDARSQSEYEGTDDRDNPRHGHIPGAVNYNWKNIYSSDGTLRPKGDIESELESKGLLQDGALVIPYCQGGFRSAVVYTVLRWLGRDNVKNYDGSWYQYSRNQDWEVEQQ